MSNKVKLSTKGDIEIKGVGVVEVKAATGKNDDGGRLGHGGASAESIIAILEKYADVAPSLNKHMQLGNKTMGLGSFIQLLNQDLPIENSENIKIRKEIARNIFEKQFGSHATPLINAFSQESADEIVTKYIESNWSWYIDMAYFDAMLFIGFNNKRTMTIKSAKDIVELVRSNLLGSIGVSVVPSNSSPREAFVQLKMNKGKA
jgi:hypothetical protein